MKTIWIERRFALQVELPDKIEKRKHAIEKLDYQFKYEPRPNETVELTCVRTYSQPNTLWELLVSRRCDQWQPIEISLTELINEAYDILYGEENDADV